MIISGFDALVKQKMKGFSMKPDYHPNLHQTADGKDVAEGLFAIARALNRIADLLPKGNK